MTVLRVLLILVLMWLLLHSEGITVYFLIIDALMCFGPILIIILHFF